MSTISDFIVSLWFVPIVLQIILPLVILIADVLATLVHNVTATHGTIVRPITPLPSGGLKV